MVVIIIAFGHSLLSMSGFETLAQVYREIASPKMKNLKITANITCWYAVLCTGVISLFAVMIIPDDVRPMYINNLIGGLAMNLSGPYLLRLGFHIFVVIVGGLILSGAVNTSIIGANGVLNRVAEDGVLVPWFREPHKRYGTTFRMINMITLLQLATIVYSRGDMTILAEAYAFGVVWSFFMKALGVTVLRFQRTDQEYKVPAQFPHRRPRDSGRPGRDHAGAGSGGHRQSVHQANRHQVRRGVHAGLVCDVHDFRKDQSAAQADRAQGDGAVQPGSSGADRRRQLCTRGPAAFWWRCAITIAWST